MPYVCYVCAYLCLFAEMNLLLPVHAYLCKLCFIFTIITTISITIIITTSITYTITITIIIIIIVVIIIVISIFM